MSASISTLSTATAARLTEAVLEKLFGDQQLHYDLREGTIRNAAGTRLMYLNADLIRGAQAGLEYEVGEGWHLIFKHCGRLWGQRLISGLRRDLRSVAQIDLGNMPLDELLRLLRIYFGEHGWGRLEIMLDDAEDHGIIVARLDNSLFPSVLDKVEGQTDDLVAGMLQSIFEALSGQNLDCLQLPGPDGPPTRSVFVISGVDRIRALQADPPRDLDDGLRRLRFQ